MSIIVKTNIEVVPSGEHTGYYKIIGAFEDHLDYFERSPADEKTPNYLMYIPGTNQNDSRPTAWRVTESDVHNTEEFAQ